MTAAPLALEGWTAEAKAAFHLRLRARGVRNHAVLRAFEIVPRGLFRPARLVALAARDMPLPLPCGQTSHETWRSALAVEALGVRPGHRVLEIGSGSGYVTAVLAQLGGEILGLERWAELAVWAQWRLEAMAITTAAVVWANGLAVPTGIGTFDRILVHAVLPDGVDMTALLEPGGRLVAGRSDAILYAIEAGAEHKIGLTPYGDLVPGLAGGESRARADGRTSRDTDP